jgi:TamB, inner membrane protein subunit of TAM complex/AsmA-like C-terminal region
MLVENDQEKHSKPKRKWRRRIWISLASFLALLLIFHRPILLGAIHWFAVHRLAKENLRLDFRVEGNVFTSLTIRNLHVTPTGPAAIEVAEAEYLHTEYNLFSLLRGHADFLNSIEARNARVVIDPAKVRVKVAPRPHEKVTLPAVFPERARLDNVSMIVRDPAHDFIAENVSLDLNPRAPGSLSITLLQLVTGEKWTRVTGATSYENRNLTLRDVVLNEQTQFKLINVDASHIRQHTMALRGVGTLDGAPVDVQASLTEQARSLFIKSHVTARDLSLSSAKKLGLFADAPVQGDIESFTFDFAGLLRSPKTWAVSGEGIVRDLQVAGATFDRATAHILAHDGVATIEPVELTRAGTGIQVHGTVQLPEKADDLGRSPAKFEIVSNDLDLAPITSAIENPLTGHGQINGRLEVRDQQMQLALRVGTGAISSRYFSLEKLEAAVTATKNLRAQTKDAPWFEGMRADVNVVLSAARNNEFAVDTVSAHLEQNGDLVKINNLTIQRGPNQIAGSGSVRLLADEKDFTKQPATIQFVINAPQTGDFWNGNSPNRVTGVFNASGSVRWNGAIADGWFNVYGTNLQARNLSVPQLSGVGLIWQSTVFLNDLSANLNQRDFVNGQGTLDLRGERKFAGKLAIDIADLNTLKPLLEASGNKSELGGSFTMNWNGHGSLTKLTEIGSLKLDWKNGRLGNMKAMTANIDATYSQAGLEVPTLFIGSDRMDFQAVVSAKDNTLEISKIQLDQGQAKYATGYVSVPFIWKNVGTNQPVFPRDGKVNATFDSANLDLKKLFDDFGMEPAASGFLSIKLQAGGTLANLQAHLDVEGRDLRNPKLTNLDPATFRLSAAAAEKKINVTGELKQPKIQPVSIAATMPFDAGKILSTRSFDENTPVQATVRMPRSSVNFLRQFIPAVEQLDGDLAFEVAIGGTVARPALSGSGDITINAARFTNATLPALHGFQSRLLFRDNTMTLERFRGDLAGGPFTLGGHVVFTKLTEPNMDVDLRAESILIARNDSLTARADASLKVTGPVTSATVKGNVALTDSHFLKDIDLIPIGLPGRPAPQPIEERPDYSIKTPPMRDWKFDMAIKTKDPFSIRGNLANGGAIIDLHLGGTGAHPELKGTVKLQNVEATLPFSQLDVTNGFLYFDPSDSFNPKIDLQGRSLIRDYTVRVYVYGSSLAPQAVFTSEPPLPQEEIISLLATGTTRQELTGSGNVLAGRAAMLVVQQLYRKVFKKGQPTQSNSVFDRLQVDLGTVDPRTGREQATARFKVNENWVLVGDIGVGGEFRGQVKYLIRFH